jgi:hypothetical protein
MHTTQSRVSATGTAAADGRWGSTRLLLPCTPYKCPCVTQREFTTNAFKLPCEYHPGAMVELYSQSNCGINLNPEVSMICTTPIQKRKGYKNAAPVLR